VTLRKRRKSRRSTAIYGGEHVTPHDPRRVFLVIQNVNTGSIAIEQSTGSPDEMERLKEFLATGTDPGENPSNAVSTSFVLETTNWTTPTILFVAPKPHTPSEWFDLVSGARARYQYVADLSTEARLQMLEQPEQAAFGCGLASYIVWNFSTHGIVRIPHSSQKLG
jgi:hypothetical protein